MTKQSLKTINDNSRLYLTFCLCSLLLFSLLMTAASAEVGGQNDIVSLKSDKVSISVQRADLAEVFEMISRHGKINILLANGVQGEVSINLYNVDLQKAIWAIAISAGFVVERSGNTYFVLPRTEAGKDIVDGLTEVKSYKVQYSDPQAVADILKDHLSRYGKITALPDRRLIVVDDLPEFLLRAEKLLEELDHQPVQILIEAQVLEISLERSEVYGVDWRKLFTPGGGTAAIGTNGLAATSAGVFFSIVNPSVEAALGALSAKNRVRTLSTPKLMALEHKEAEVVIGDRIGYREITTSANGNTESIRFLDSGVILRVTPFVDRSGKIMMRIHPEVSSATVTAGIPSLQTTEVTTELLAADGETIFIGGLIKNNATNSRRGVPVLGDVPVLGYLFRNQEDTVTNTETIVMITPRIIPSDRSELSEIERSESLQDKNRVDGIDLNLHRMGKDVDAIFKNHRPLGVQ